MTHTKPHVAVPQSDEVSARGTRVQHGATTNRRTGAVKLAARFLTAMAIVSLAIMYIATRDQLPDASADTGKINALNVGTCYASDEDEFRKSDCLHGENVAYDVAGRKDVTQTDMLYATYAVDPRTSAESPRAILYNADLIRVSIKDAGRDKRIGVLYGVGQGSRLTALGGFVDGNGGQADAFDNYLSVITEAVDVDALAENVYTAPTPGDPDADPVVNPTPADLDLSSDTAGFRVTDATNTLLANGIIEESGETQLSLVGIGRGANPIAPINDDDNYGLKLGKVKFFGFLQDNGGSDLVPTATTGPFREISTYLPLDEDYGCPVNPTLEDPDAACDNKPPWVRVGARVPTDKDITVMYVYYETSQREEIVGGRSKAEYDADQIVTDPGNPNADPVVPPTTDDFDAEDPGFSSDESASSNAKSLLVSVRADGERESRNLWLRETGRFTGTYVGYVRLTDSNGNGTEAGDKKDPDDQTQAAPADNWGRKVRHGEAGDDTTAMIAGAAVIGVESGPVTIRYRDTDDDEQTMSIMIDTSAPTITVDAPADMTSTRDASPNLSGTFNDAGSGLSEESFRLFADNKDDAEEDGNNGTPVFDLEVYGAGDPVRAAGDRGIVTTPTGVDAIEIAGSYSGFANADDTTFGIVRASEVYLPEDGDDSTYASKDDASLRIAFRKIVRAEDFDDGATTGEFDQSIRFDFASELPNETFNNTIDFQAVVMDRAGNLGFSDSEPSSPRFIHEYGVKSTDRKRDKHNVLGWYSRHILFLDLVDPTVQEDESATGFFGVEDDKDQLSDKGVMVVFDKPVSDSTITTSTFDVTLDDGSDANVVDFAVEGRKVFLQLEEALAPDATPKVDLAAGEVVRDLAGNQTVPREFTEIEVSDGILPTFTVELSAGSGQLPPDYGPDKITKDRITVKITSNEAIQGAPKFAVLCANFTWYDTALPAGQTYTDAEKETQREGNDIDRYVTVRTGSKTTSEFAEAEPTRSQINTQQENCQYPTDDDGKANPARIATITALQRGGNNWEYQWSNLDSLRDGQLTVVVTGRDRGGFKRGEDTVANYGTATVDFTLDSTFISPTAEGGGGGEVIPNKNEAVSEPRPFVLIDFSEKTPVTVTKFEVDNVDVLGQVETLDDNRFVYWPEPLDIGNYTVKVEANDAANNTTDFQYKFTVRERLPFALNLLAGWNTISFPANPQDRALHAVFTEPDIDQVIGWDATNPNSPWRAATRVDGVWTTGEDYAVLNDVESRYGYWVHSQGFVTQSVKLVGKGDRIGPLFDETTDIPTNARGWNFVGVVDVDGDQTEDNAGQTLLNSKKAPISASQYLGDYRNAYTWNNIDNKWQRMRPDGPITIGTGIWVYYDKGGDIAP